MNKKNDVDKKMNDLVDSLRSVNYLLEQEFFIKFHPLLEERKEKLKKELDELMENYRWS